MKMKLSTLLLAGFVSAPAFADSPRPNYFAGLQFAQTTYQASGGDEDLDPTVLVGRFGYYYSENISLEGRFGVGLARDSVSGYGSTATVEIDQIAGIYGVGHLPIADAASVYILAGFTHGRATARFSTSQGIASETAVDSGLSYGFGAEFNVSSSAALTVEYVSYLNKSDYQINALSAGISFKF